MVWYFKRGTFFAFNICIQHFNALRLIENENVGLGFGISKVEHFSLSIFASSILTLYVLSKIKLEAFDLIFQTRNIFHFQNLHSTLQRFTSDRKWKWRPLIWYFKGRMFFAFNIGIQHFNALRLIENENVGLWFGISNVEHFSLSVLASRILTLYVLLKMKMKAFGLVFQTRNIFRFQHLHSAF